MRYSVALFFSVSAVGCLLPGCVADHASPIDEAKTQDDLISQLPDKPANPEDPFGSCEQDGDPYPEFLFTECSNTELGCVTHFEGDQRGGRLWQICEHGCDNTSQCPVPITGDAAPECAEEGRCLLPCDGDTVCPDGFTCASVAEVGEAWGGTCMQYGIFGPMP